MGLDIAYTIHINVHLCTLISLWICSFWDWWSFPLMWLLLPKTLDSLVKNAFICDDTCTLKVCGWCWNEENIFACDCFFSIHLSNNSFSASMHCIYAKYNVRCTCIPREQNVIFNSTFPFLARIYTIQSIHTYSMHMLNKKEFHFEIYLARLICFFPRLTFLLLFLLLFIHSLLFLLFSMSVYCIRMRKVYISASGKHHHLIWFSIKMYMLSPHYY